MEAISTWPSSRYFESQTVSREKHGRGSGMSRWVGVGFVLIFSSYFGFRFQSLNLYVKMFSQYHGGKLTFIVEMELRLKAMIKAKRRSGEGGRGVL